MPSSDPPFVLFVHGDPAVRGRIGRYFRPIESLRILSSDTIPSDTFPSRFAAFVLPAERAVDYLHMPVPILAHGHSRALPPCLRAGCYDFLRDPWVPEELYCRLARCVCDIPLRFAGLVLHRNELRGPGGSVTLTQTEYVILKLLVLRSPEVVPRQAAYAMLHSAAAEQSRMVDVYVTRLRKLLAGVSESSYPRIEAHRGNGYALYCRPSL